MGQGQADLTPGGSPHRYETLDALRGICACLVALYHFRDNVSPITATSFTAMSWQFVDLFFVISGFVIALNYQDKLQTGLSFGRFMQARFARIYPLHLFMLGVFLLTEIGFVALSRHGGSFHPFDAAHQPSDLIKQLLFLDGLGNVQQGGWNYPTWSIATEFWAYVVFAIAVSLLRGARLAAFAAAVIVLCPVFLFYFSPRGIQTIADWGLIRCLYGFALGAICWQIWPAWRRRTSGWTPLSASAVEIVVMAVVLLFVPLAGPTKWNLLAPFLFAATVLVFARQGGIVSRVLMMRLPMYLGTISYSIYLVHVYVEARLRNLSVVLTKVDGRPHTTSVFTSDGHVQRLTGGSPLEGTLFLIAMLVIVVGIASITYRLVELPGQRWLRPRKARSVEAAAA